MDIMHIIDKFSFFKYTTFFLLFILLSGCSFKHLTQNRGAIVTIRTDNFKFSDTAFIRQSGDEIELELFVSGQVIDKFEIDTLVCTSKGCMTKSSFNKAFLSPYYPDNILKKILQSKPIYDGINLKRKAGGFVQNIVTNVVNIEYSVTNKLVRFKDRKNGILIKIKTIKG